jgi:hypothetical protein
MGRFDLVRPILTDLRDTWAAAMEQQKQKDAEGISEQEDDAPDSALSA